MAEGAAPEQTMNLKAVVIGGTGAVGKSLVGELVNSKNFSKIVVLGRRNTTIPESYGVDQSAAENEGRLMQVTVDFEALTKESVGEHFQDKDVFFSTLGTTRGAAGSAEAFKHIDHGYTMKCAEIAKTCGIPHMSLLTSQGAKANSWLLYTKTKGEIEEDSKKLDFNWLSIFRPGLLDRGGNARMVEKVAGWFVRSIAVDDVAKAMRVDAEQEAKNKSTERNEKFCIYHNAEIRNFCKEST